MTLKIELQSTGKIVTLRLIGRIRSECLEGIRSEVQKHPSRLALDLGDVTLVDTAVVRFLVACEAEGIELRNCAPYIREWMERERGLGK